MLQWNNSVKLLDTEFLTSRLDRKSSILYLTKTSCWNFSASFLLMKIGICTWVVFGFSMQYIFVALIFLLGLSTNVIAFWICFKCSSKPLDRGEVTIGRQFSSLENSAVATTIGFRSLRGCLKSNSTEIICWCLRKSALSSLLNTFNLAFSYLLSFLSFWEQELLPNPSSLLTKSTQKARTSHFV